MEFKFIYDYYRDLGEINSFRYSAKMTTQRRRKLYQTRINPLQDLTDREFKLRYRFTKTNMQKIFDILRPALHVDSRGGGIPVELQIMAVIRYWGRHEIQEDCANMHGMSQQTLSRLARRVAIALASKSSIYIKMPSTTRDEAVTIQKFEAICGIQGINGAIGCTNIKVRKLGDVHQYQLNRKGHYSINAQVVCDADLKICDIVCHWREGTHDDIIYRESSIKRRYEENDFVGKLIGSSKYQCTPHLTTLILKPSTEEQMRFNHQHFQASNIIERCLGVWNNQFRILLEVMRGSHSTIKTTIVACAILHNLAIFFNEDQDTTEQNASSEATEEEIMSFNKSVNCNNHFIRLNKKIFI